MKLTYGSSARIYYSSPTLGLSLSLVTDKTTEEHALSPAKTEGGWDVPSEGESLKKKKKNSWFSGTSALENKTGAVHLCRYAPYCHRSLENNRCACLMCCEFKHFPPSLITMFEVPLSIALTKVLSGQWFETVVCTGQLPVVLWTRVTKRQRAPESGHSGSNRLVVNKGREADSEFIG